MRRKVKKLLLGIVGALSLLTVLYAYATHGWIWSIYVPIYDRLLNSFPSPPGLLLGQMR
mgnify:CR=1 FL=1